MEIEGDQDTHGNQFPVSGFQWTESRQGPGCFKKIKAITQFQSFRSPDPAMRDHPM
jgi:hypothetical protein